MEIIILFILLAIFLIGGMEIAVALGAASVITVLLGFQSLDVIVIPQRILSTLSRAWSLLTIPIFIMLGEVFIIGGISKRLIDVANIFVGSLPGGLGIVNIVASYFFGGISGSASADTAAIGGIMIPAMIKEGYDSKFSTVVTITSSTLGPIVPPSILMILIAWVTDLPVGALFLAGYIPAFFIMLGLIMMTYIISKIRNYPRHDRPPFKKAVKIVIAALPALITPFIIVGGIVFGIATVVEVSSIALLYGCIVAGFIYKELKLKDFPKILKNTSRITVSIGLILAFASGFSWLITYSRLPFQVANLLITMNVGPSLFMILSCGIFLILGTFLNPGAIVLMTMPVLFPIATALGINPYHFSLICALAMCIGHVTPPVGLCLFIGCSISGDKIEDLVRPLIPYVLTMVGVILILIFCPAFILWLPRLFGY